MKHNTLVSTTLTKLTHFPKKISGKVTDNLIKSDSEGTLLKICKFPKRPEALAGSVL